MTNSEPTAKPPTSILASSLIATPTSLKGSKKKSSPSLEKHHSKRVSLDSAHTRTTHSTATTGITSLSGGGGEGQAMNEDSERTFGAPTMMSGGTSRLASADGSYSTDPDGAGSKQSRDHAKKSKKKKKSSKSKKNKKKNLRDLSPQSRQEVFLSQQDELDGTFNHFLSSHKVNKKAIETASLPSQGGDGSLPVPDQLTIQEYPTTDDGGGAAPAPAMPPAAAAGHGPSRSMSTASAPPAFCSSHPTPPPQYSSYPTDDMKYYYEQDHFHRRNSASGVSSSYPYSSSAGHSMVSEESWERQQLRQQQQQYYYHQRQQQHYMMMQQQQQQQQQSQLKSPPPSSKDGDAPPPIGEIEVENPIIMPAFPVPTNHHPYRAASVSSSAVTPQSHHSDSHEEAERMAEFHGEMLESFLKRNGQDEQLALATAVAFESFLKSQQDQFTTVSSSRNSSHDDDDDDDDDHDDDDDDDEEEETADDEDHYHPGTGVVAAAQPQQQAQLPKGFGGVIHGLRDLTDEVSAMGDSFAAESTWDNGTFVTYPNVSGSAAAWKMHQMQMAGIPPSAMKHHAQHPSAQFQQPYPYPPPPGHPAYQQAYMGQMPPPPQPATPNQQQQPSQHPKEEEGDGFMDGTVRRNESFMRRKSGQQTEGGAESIRTTSTRSMTSSSGVGGGASFAGAGPSFVGDERPFVEQLASMTSSQRSCVLKLKSKWEQQHSSKALSLPNEWYIRFAKCSPGKPYDFRTAFKIMKKMNRRYLCLTAKHLQGQLRTKTLFPCPGLKSKEGYDVCYMRPSRFFPKEMPLSHLIDNLIYVMNCMLEKEQSCSDGIAFLANMRTWDMSNFSVPYCHKFMQALQGRLSPTRVGLFLIVDPPAWFGSIWAIMRPMLSDDFRRKVHMIPVTKLQNYLAPGFEEFLPDEFLMGQAPTSELVSEFVSSRKTKEGIPTSTAPGSGGSTTGSNQGGDDFNVEISSHGEVSSHGTSQKSQTSV